MATLNNAVRFVYVSSGQQLPQSPDADTIYFLVDQQQLYVGSELIANNVTVNASGEGDYVSGLSFDSSTHTLSATFSSFPNVEVYTSFISSQTLAFGASFSVITSEASDVHDPLTAGLVGTTFTLPAFPTTPESPTSSSTLSYGGSFVAVTGVDSDANFLTTKFTLPAGVSYVTLTELGGSTFDAVQVVYTDGTSTFTSLENGGAPTVDYMNRAISSAISGLSGAMHFLGESTTAITNGGTETPTIDGKAVTPKTGDVVLYNGLEFVWDGAHWIQLGDEASFALKTVSISAGEGLTGGGTLASDRTISHASLYSRATSFGGSNIFEGVHDITVDKFGHITSVATRSVSAWEDAISSVALNAVSSITTSAITSTGSSLVTESAVYNAIQSAGVVWNVI